MGEPLLLPGGDGAQSLPVLAGLLGTQGWMLSEGRVAQDWKRMLGAGPPPLLT